MSFTDGICHACAARVRADHLRVRFDPAPAAGGRSRAWAPGLAVVSLTVAIALVLVARPTHDPVLPVVSDLPPLEPVPANPASHEPRPAVPEPATRGGAHVRAERPAERPAASDDGPDVRAHGLERTLTWVRVAALSHAVGPLTVGRSQPAPRGADQSP